MPSRIIFTVLLVGCAYGIAKSCPCEFEDAYRSWDCSHLKLTKVPSSCWGKHTEARRVFLYKNRLRKIEDDTFSSLTDLHYLFLYSNKIYSMSENSLASLETLKYLDLSFNSLKTLPTNVFDNLGALKYLFIYNNSLEDFPSLENLTSVKSIYLHNNKLTSLPIMPTSSEPIDLVFYGNSITKVPAVALLPLLDHSFIRMDRDTVICCQDEDERLELIRKDWLVRDQDSNGLFLNHIAVVCKEPEDE